MPTPARHPVREHRLDGQPATRAFTLIELLTVIAIIAILAAISIGIVKGVRERAGINRAKAELAILATALDAYKHQYGDYPQAGKSTDSDVSVETTHATSSLASVRLFNALVGKLGPTMVDISGKGKSFVDLGALVLESSDENDIPASTGGNVNNSFVDPWGNRYLYYYKTVNSTDWPKSRGYILLSAGPDGMLTEPDTTPTIDLKTTAVHNGDNVYANQ